MRSLRECKRCKGRWQHADSGQGTVEFCLVLCGFLAVVVGLGALVHLGTDGALVNHALRSAAHYLGASPAFVLADIFAV